jgi:hypothetical protein
VDGGDDDAVSEYTTGFVLQADTYDQVCYVGTATEPTNTGTQPDTYEIELIAQLQGFDTADEFIEDFTIALKNDTLASLLGESGYWQKDFISFALKYARDNDPFGTGNSNRRRLLATDEEAVLDLISFVDESVVVEYTADENTGEIVIVIQLSVSGDRAVESSEDGAGSDPETLNLEDLIAALTEALNDDDSTLAKTFDVTSDSVTAVTLGKLCADGSVDDGEGSCENAGGQVNSTTDDGLDDGQIAIIAIVGAIVLITLIVLLYSKKKKQGARADKFDDVQLDPTALQAPGAAPAPEYVEGGDVAYTEDGKEEEEVATDNVQIEMF